MADPKYDPKLVDLVDRIAHAGPSDEPALRDAIRDNYSSVGDIGGAFVLHSALSDTLSDPALPESDRQRLRQQLAPYTLQDGPETVGKLRSAVVSASSLAGVLAQRRPPAEAASAVTAPRGGATASQGAPPPPGLQMPAGGLRVGSTVSTVLGSPAGPIDVSFQVTGVSGHKLTVDLSVYARGGSLGGLGARNQAGAAVMQEPFKQMRALAGSAGFDTIQFRYDRVPPASVDRPVLRRDITLPTIRSEP